MKTRIGLCTQNCLTLSSFFLDSLRVYYLSAHLCAQRNNLGTALFQKGEHTLAKVEHRAVLALLEATNIGLSQPGGRSEGHDVYIDTLVNLHR